MLTLICIHCSELTFRLLFFFSIKCTRFWTDTTAVIWYLCGETQQKAKQEATHTHTAGFIHLYIYLFLLRSYWRGRWLQCGISIRSRNVEARTNESSFRISVIIHLKPNTNFPLHQHASHSCKHICQAPDNMHTQTFTPFRSP